MAYIFIRYDYIPDRCPLGCGSFCPLNWGSGPDPFSDPWIHKEGENDTNSYKCMNETIDSDKEYFCDKWNTIPGTYKKLQGKPSDYSDPIKSPRIYEDPWHRDSKGRIIGTPAGNSKNLGNMHQSLNRYCCCKKEK